MKELLNILREERREAYDHSQRVGNYAFFLAIALGKDERTADVWQNAGYLHDIGKITISEDILNAPRCLTAEERAEVAKHSINGADILSKSTWAKKEYIDAAKLHHQHFNAGGKAIPLVARVIAVVDVYDALTAKRCYKEGMTPRQAFEIMDDMQKNLQFDPDIYAAWKNVISGVGNFIYANVA